MLLESQEKDQLYTALSQAQSEYPTIRFNRKAFKNQYADLYAVLKHVYPVLKKYGLSIKPWAGELNGEQWIGARLSHKSGQYETNIFKFESDPCKNPNDQPSHKKQGALTYFNRNHMKDMLGVLISDDPEDDDGQGHHENNNEKQPQVVQNTPHFQPSVRNEVVTAEQLEEIEYVLQGQPLIANKVLDGFKIESLSDIPKDQYLKTIERIRFLKDQYNNVKK